MKQQEKSMVAMSIRLLAMAVAGCFVCSPALANPSGAQVVSGKVTFNNSGNILTITTTPGSVINWLSFSINPGQVTQFLQQNSSSSVLNRIIGQNPSQIFGTLESNGRVYLINPNGILFGEGSQVNVGGLVASSLAISNTDFAAGKNNFSAAGQTPGSVVNQGRISTPSGGSIYLIAPQVQNSGVLTSPQGDIVLAAGHSVQLIDGADPNVQVVISAPTDQALNLGQVIAQGGKIGVLGALVNQGGQINADSATVGQRGQIVLKSSQTTLLSGDSQTTAVGNTGGTIVLSGPQVGLTDNAVVNVSGQNGGGKVIIGGDFHGANPAISNANAVYIGSDASVKADGIGNGNGGAVAVWSDNATRDYGTISAQGGAQGGNGGYVETSSKNYLDFQGLVNVKAGKGKAGTLLLDPYDIVIDNSSASYGGTISCTGCPGAASVLFTNVGPATPSVIGNAYLASQLATGDVTVSTVALGGAITVNSPVIWSSGHMLTLAATGDIAINAAISGSSGAEKLALTTSGGNITENGSGYINVGQLSAVASAGNVTLNNEANVAATLAGVAGGSGGFQFTSGTSAISVASANGVTGLISAGPISLQAANGIAINAPVSAIGNAIALTANAGGISQNASGTISAASLQLDATSDIGSPGAALNTSVNALQVFHANNVYINNSNNGDLSISGISGTGVVNVSTAGTLTVPVNDGGLNFTGSSITLISAGNMSLGAGNGYSALDGTGPITLLAGFTQAPGSITPLPNFSLATLTQGGTFYGASIDLWANSYRDFSGSASYSNTPGFHPGPNPILVYVTGTNVADKTYDGTTLATLSGGSLVGIPGDDLAGISWTQSGTFGSKNAGSNIAVTANDVLTLAPGLAGDFVLVQPTGLSATINPAIVTITGQSAANKIYDGTIAATLSGGSLNGVITADSSLVSLTQSGSFASANVGNAITVIAADTLSGAGASNYTLMQPTGLFANIVASSNVSVSPVLSQTYITALNLTNSAGGTGTSGSSTALPPSTTQTGATNNAAAKKLYCN